MAEKISRRQFKKQQRKANENLSRLLNPNNAYKRRQKDILKSIFK
jgi:hypothetical protein